MGISRDFIMRSGFGEVFRYKQVKADPAVHPRPPGKFSVARMTWISVAVWWLVWLGARFVQNGALAHQRPFQDARTPFT